MNNLAKEEEALAGWPRRLLHVPSLTSFEWGPGNTYGGISNPAYNAITYTWGRWRLNDATSPPEKPEVHAIPIQRCSWPIPRVDPAHFTVHEFQHTIEAATMLQPWMMKVRKDHEQDHVEFIWLDVACIDQRPSEPRSAAEIGRQAAIFRGAKRVFAWLTTLDNAKATDMVLSMTTFGDYNPKLANTPDDQTAINHITEFLADPWFSSLWTLQEAFLRDDAYLLTRDAQLLEYHHSSKDIRGNIDLAQVFDWGFFWSQRCFRKASSKSSPLANTYKQSMDLIAAKGIKALSTTSPIATWEATNYRTTLYPEDRIYAIQQIFDFRLGKSAIDAPRGHEFSVAELRDQFGEQLMKRYPVTSQCHVFTKNVPRQKRWRLDVCSVVPPASDSGSGMFSNMDDTIRSMEGDEPFCTLSVDHGASHGKLPVIWEERICLLADLVAASRKLSEEPLFRDLPILQGMLHIIPDAVDEMKGSPEDQAIGYHAIPRGKRQARFAEWLFDHFGSENLHVFLLGHSSRLNRTVGILFKKEDDDFWCRLGICEWDITWLQISVVESLQKPFFTGNDERWKQSRGIFGYANLEQ